MKWMIRVMEWYGESSTWDKLGLLGLVIVVFKVIIRPLIGD